MSPPRTVRVLALAALAATACSSGGNGGPDTDGGPAVSPDGGATPQPLPVPFVRIVDAQLGTSHGLEMQGVVDEIGPARNVPAVIAAADPEYALTVHRGDGSQVTLWYTLPAGFTFMAHVNDSLHLWYREAVQGYGSSYGVHVNDVDDNLIAIFEDGSNGPALETAERYGMDFRFEDVPLDEQVVSCGRRVRHPLDVTLPPAPFTRVDPGHSEPFALPGGAPVTFTLLDCWRIEDSTCGQAAPYSFGYVLKP